MLMVIAFRCFVFSSALNLGINVWCRARFEAQALGAKPRLASTSLPWPRLASSRFVSSSLVSFQPVSSLIVASRLVSSHLFSSGHFTKATSVGHFMNIREYSNQGWHNPSRSNGSHDPVRWVLKAPEQRRDKKTTDEIRRCE